jgi:hypothetical protein
MQIPVSIKKVSVIRMPTALLVATLFCGLYCFGQRTACELAGTVTDSSGAVVPGAEVIITNTETGITETKKTNDVGEYLFPTLRPGTYTLRVSAAGFKTQDVQPFKLYIDQAARRDITLAVGSTTETITVSAGSVILQTENASQEQVIENKQISDLPLNGRNFMQLAHLSTAVTPIMSGMNTAATYWGGGGGAGTGAVSMSIAGTREDDVSYLLDGIETRNSWFGAVGIRPSVEAIQEFKVQQTGSSAAYGFGAVFVNSTLKSGTNTLHGTAYEFLRNNVLDARNFFDRGSPPPFRQNQFGGNVGGPVVKNKVFFFFNYEGFRQSRPFPWYTRVPTAAHKQGNFSDLATQLVNPFTGAAIPGNIIDPNITPFSPAGVKALSYFPDPNGNYPGGNNYFTNRSTQNRWNQVNARGDYYSTHDSLAVSFTLYDLTSIRPGLVDDGNVTFPLNNRSVAIGWVHTFSPTMVNEFHLGWSRTDSGEIRAHGYDEAWRNPLGLANSGNTPGQYGLPGIYLRGYGSPSPGAGTNIIHDNIFMATDSLLLQKGKQAIRVGGDIRFEPMYMYENWANPYVTWNGSYSGEPVADLLLGVFSDAGTALGDPTLHWRRWYQAYYVQDDIKVTPRLTLNLGLLYEYVTVPVDTRNHVGAFDPATGDVVNYPDTARLGLGRAMAFPDRNNFAPRFGLAWRPFGEKTVIRAGYGVYYMLSNMNQYEQLVDGPKYYLYYSFINSPAGQPPAFVTDQLYDTTKTAFGLIGSVDMHNRTGYTHSWSLSVQRMLGRNWLVELGTLGNAGHKIAMRNNINTPLSPGVYPYALFQGGNSYTINAGNSIYNALTAKVEKKYSSGLSFLSSYTYSKCLDLGWTDEFTLRPYDLRGQRGHCTYDLTQRLAVSTVYGLPFGRGKAFLNSGGVTNAVLGGWQVSGIAQFSTGAWVNAYGAQFIGFFVGALPNVIGPVNDPALRGSIRKNNLHPYFNVSSFQPITTLCCGMAVQGNAGRNIIMMPGVNNWDLSLFKTWLIAERLNINFRTDFFNAFNHAQFNGLQTAVYAKNFGYVTSAAPAREIQFSLKLDF